MSVLLFLPAWAAGLLGVIAVGFALSAMTSRAAARLVRVPGSSSPGSRALSGSYAAVLWLLCAYFYASVLLGLLALAAGGAFVLWRAFAVTEGGGRYIGGLRVPLVLSTVVGLAVLGATWATLRSVWRGLVRPPDRDPAPRLAPGRYPDFDRMVREVAEQLGTRPVDAVFLTPGSEVAVFERGGVARQLGRERERSLILGVGAIEALSRAELRAVLAHEYGHLVNRDTAGGKLALAVRRAALSMLEQLARTGGARWFNPAWSSLRLFHAVFLRVSRGASRLQEILADRWAAAACGGETFGRGLTHLVERSVRFERNLQRALARAVELGVPLVNVYRLGTPDADDLRAVDEAMQRSSALDSHPRPLDRIAWTREVRSAWVRTDGDAAPAWTLFPDRERLEREMTARIAEAVAAAHGVVIPAPRAEAGGA